MKVYDCVYDVPLLSSLEQLLSDSFILDEVCYSEGAHVHRVSKLTFIGAKRSQRLLWLAK